MRGLSPFTNEKTPSFYVLPAKGIFKCFSSGKGSVVTFLMELEKASYPEALRMLARRYNIEVQEKERTPEEIAAASAKEGLANLVGWASKWFMDQMRNTDAGKAIGRSYFVERGFRDDVLDTFLIGYSPDSWDALASSAGSRLHARQVGRGRPVQAARGRIVVGFFQGPGHVPDSGCDRPRHWIWRPHPDHGQESCQVFQLARVVLYNKSKVLYGVHLAKPAIVKEERCFGGGYTDVMAMHQAGVTNVVSSSGTAHLHGPNPPCIRRSQKHHGHFRRGRGGHSGVVAGHRHAARRAWP